MNIDDSAAQLVFARFKRNGSVAELNELLKRLCPVIEAVICKRLGYLSSEYDELRSHALCRLCRGLQARFDPQRGSLFNFASKVTENSMIDCFRRRVNRERHFALLDDEGWASFSVNGADHRHTMADIAYKVMGMRTPFHARNEVAGQRWLVCNLLASDFCFRRHQASDALARVYGIAPDRARKIFDLSVLSIRRVLLDERRLRPLVFGRDRQSRGLRVYQARLSVEEFTKLCWLMRNLPPSLIETEGLHNVLYGPGSPAERALFSHAEAFRAASGHPETL
jgi:hypothetical protein